MYNDNNAQGMNQWGQANPPHHGMDEAKKTCIKFMNFYVIGQLGDGSQVEGIIEDMDDDNVTMLVPETVEEEEVNGNRQFGGYGGGWYDGYSGGYGRRSFRRFRRRRFPFRSFVFPFIFPFPFYF